MANLKIIHGKAKPASKKDMQLLHLSKQKGLAKWKKIMKLQNPDLEVLEGRYVVCLSNINNDQQAKSTDVEGTIFKADNGKYYAKVIGRKLAIQHLPPQEREIDVPPQRSNAGEMPPSDDEDEYY